MKDPIRAHLQHNPPIQYLEELTVACVYLGQLEVQAGVLPKQFYSDPSFERQEYEKIWHPSWIFVAMADELANHNDFVTVSIFGHSIVIQNFQGELAAFQNVCAHRFNRIQAEACGNRRFQCAYHAWIYNVAGQVVGVPQRTSFDGEKLTNIRLQKYEVGVCGEFVFCKISEKNSASLEDFLGTFAAKLMNYSAHIAEQLNKSDITHEANWKLLIENVLEAYHCPLVHQSTLVHQGYCLKPPENIHFDGSHSEFELPKLDNVNAEKRKTLSFLDKRTHAHDTFHHIHIFPSLVFSSTEGAFYYIGNLLPVSSTRTVLRVRFYAPEIEDADQKSRFLRRAYFNAGVESAIKVLMEDKPMVEGCQQGLMEPSAIDGTLSNSEEIRLQRFQQEYSRLMQVH